MKKLKVGYCDFWGHFDFYGSKFYEILSKHYNVIVDNVNPELLFFSSFPFGSNNKKYNCTKIHVTGECDWPDRYNADYFIGFDYNTMPNYLQCTWFFIENEFLYKCCGLEKLKNRLQKIDNNNRGFCCFVSSNYGNDEITWKRPSSTNFINGAKYRIEIVDYLSKNYKKVDCGGKVLNNVGNTIPFEVDAMCDFYKGHKFSIVFENQSHPGYMTEKIFMALANNSIPIYFGDPTIDLVINNNLFINANKLTCEELVDKIKEIDNNDDLYQTYMAGDVFINDYYNKKMKELEDFLLKIVKNITGVY